MRNRNEVIISIKPKWCDLIFSGKKIDEIRKTRPKDTGFPYDVYIWQTGNGNICACNKYIPLLEHDYERGGFM